MAVKHKIKTPDGGVREVETRGPQGAIARFCTECMGFAPRAVRDCPAETCPLWPWRRGKSERTLTDEQRAEMAERAREHFGHGQDTP